MRPNGELPSDPQQTDRQAPTRNRRYAKARLAVHHRSANLIVGDGTKNGFPAPNKELQQTKNDHLTGKAPYKFESAFLQRRVCLSGEPRGSRRKAPHFGGCLRVAGDARRDVQAANRDSFALSL